MNKKLVAVVLSVCLAASSLFVYYQGQVVPADIIQTYVSSRDKAFCMRQFKEHQWLLFANPNPNMDHILDTRSPNIYEPQYAGKMAIKVMYHNQEPVGFTTYFMETTYQGKILFLVVDSKFQGQGYGKKLMLYAMEQLKNMGAKTVKLFTRHENIPAQKLYNSLGFVQENSDDYGIFYRKKL